MPGASTCRLIPPPDAIRHPAEGPGARGDLVRVVLWMTGALLSFSAMAASIRALAGTLRIMEMLAIRNGGGLAILLALSALNPAHMRALSARRLALHVTRNTIHFGSQFLWAMGITLLPLATVFALEFTMPAHTALLAAMFLGERLTPSRIGVVIFGFLGVLVILRPGLESFQPAAFLVLGVADLVPIGAVALSGLASHFCLAQAFRRGDASLVVPLDFMRIPLIAVVGWWLYGESLDAYVFLGAGLIVLGVLWNLRAEAARKTGIAK